MSPDDAIERRSPSGLPIRDLVDGGIGSRDIFVARQSLQLGDRVLQHTHPRDEVLMFLSGTGEATLDETVVSVSAGITLFIPAGIPHGFRNTGTSPLDIVVIFPGETFAETTLLESDPGLARPNLLA